MAPFVFSWALILLGIALYFLQIIWLGNCLLTRAQFRLQKRGVTFYYFLLTKLGISKGYRIRYLGDYIVPPVIFGWTILWQIVFDKKPLFI